MTAAPDTVPDAPSGPDETPLTKFATFDAWFDSWLSPASCPRPKVRTGSSAREHPEVVVRLHSLWTAWEAATAAEDGAVMSGWWVHHADSQLRTMLDAEHGPMFWQDPPGQM